MSLPESSMTLIDRLRALLGKAYLNEALMEKFYAPAMFRFLGAAFRLGCVPLLRDLFPWIDSQKNNLTCLPVNRNIEGPGGSTMTETVLEHFISHARHRVIINVCPCRKIMKCRHYPADIGCMMMGDSAVHISGEICREVGVAEARQHIQKAIGAGLIPTTGRACIDRDFFAVPDGGRLLTLCFCCECCSVTRFFRHIPTEKLDGMLHPVEGLAIHVDNTCDGCGACVSRCHLDAISLQSGRAVIGARCKVCGRCAMFCPPGAIKLTLDNPQAAQDVIRRIEASVDY